MGKQYSLTELFRAGTKQKSLGKLDGSISMKA